MHTFKMLPDRRTDRWILSIHRTMLRMQSGQKQQDLH